MLSPLDKDRIEAAVGLAEEGSTGEIICVVASEVSNYREVPIAWGAGAALLLPPIALALGLHPLLTSLTGGGWVAAHASALDADIAWALTSYAVVQAALFGVVTVLVSIPAVRRRLTPKFLKHHRVKKVAQQQFAAISARAVGSETGILLFVALQDRVVEILADRAIHDKVGATLWQTAAQAIGAGMGAGDPTEGVVKAVQLCGAALREHFPSEGANANVLSNRPLEI